MATSAPRSPSPGRSAGVVSASSSGPKRDSQPRLRVPVLRRTCPYPSPSRFPAAFEHFLRNFVAQQPVDVVVPVTDISTQIVAGSRDALDRHTAIAAPPLHAFEEITNKSALLQRAAACGIADSPYALRRQPRAAEDRNTRRQVSGGRQAGSVEDPHGNGLALNQRPVCALRGGSPAPLPDDRVSRVASVTDSGADRRARHGRLRAVRARSGQGRIRASPSAGEAAIGRRQRAL